MKKHVLIRGTMLLKRHLVFFVFGVIFGFYFFFSYCTDVNRIPEKISWWIRLGSTLLIFYPIALSIILWFYRGITGLSLRLLLLVLSKFSKEAKFVLILSMISEKGNWIKFAPIYERAEDTYLEGHFHNILPYLAGGFLGVAIFFVFAVLGLLGFFVYFVLFKATPFVVKFAISRPYEFFGIVSALVVLFSYPVYIVRIWQRKIIPNIASWTIFVLISVALALSSFTSSGFSENSWVTLGPLLGCSVILISALIRSKEKSMGWFDLICLVLASLSIVIWYFTKQNREFVQYALYLGIFADFVGLLPTSVFLFKHPEKDRPAMWIIFSFGYFLSMFAITEHTFANWILPVFMTIAPALGWYPLVRHRVHNKIPLKEWI